MSQQIVWGCVNKDGSIHSGSGFTPVDGGKGIYDIVYKVSFKAPPAVIATQNWKNWTDWTYEGGNTGDNVVLVAGDSTKCKLITGNNNGDKEDRNFCFVAIGEV
jgi:hypothetical protein